MTELPTQWEVEFTDEFEKWWNVLTEEAQEAVNAKVLMLEVRGPGLDYPNSSAIKGSKYPLRELRVQYQGDPLLIL